MNSADFVKLATEALRRIEPGDAPLFVWINALERDVVAASAAANRERMLVSRDYSAASAHRLPRVPAGHKCGNMHGHALKIRLVCQGPIDDRMGWVFDFADLDAAWSLHCGHLDHHTLNEIEGLDNPTSEILARWVFNRMAGPVANLASGACLVSVGVAESDRGFVMYGSGSFQSSIA